MAQPWIFYFLYFISCHCQMISSPSAILSQFPCFQWFLISVCLHVFIVLYSTYCCSYHVVNDSIIPNGDGVAVLQNSYWENVLFSLQYTKDPSINISYEIVLCGGVKKSNFMCVFFFFRETAVPWPEGCALINFFI